MVYSNQLKQRLKEYFAKEGIQIYDKDMDGFLDDLERLYVVLSNHESVIARSHKGGQTRVVERI